jgi:hypothetical protein
VFAESRQRPGRGVRVYLCVKFGDSVFDFFELLCNEFELIQQTVDSLLHTFEGE